MGIFQEKNKNKITKDGRSWYFVDRYEINNIKKQYKSQLFALKRDAQEEERLFLINPIEYIKNHSKRAKNTLKIENNNNELKCLNDYFQDFLIYEISFNKEVTVYNHKKFWNKHFSDNFGMLQIKDINFAKMQQMHDKINGLINKRKNAPYCLSTKNHLHTLLVNLLQYLYQNGLIEMNYSKIIGSFKNTEKNINSRNEIRYQTIEEYNLFMSVIDDEFWYCFFNFAFWQGCRKGEQRALKIKDIDLKHNAIYFNKTFSRNLNGGEKIGTIKNGKERITYLAEQSKKYVINLINFYKMMDGYSDEWFLFGGPLCCSKNKIARMLNKYYDTLEKKYPDKKINRLTHHEFGRHSHASYLLYLGNGRIDIYDIIAQRLGDTSEVIRATYAHPYESLNNDKAKELLKMK